MSAFLMTTIGRATLKNPVLLASGPAGYGLEYEGLVDLGRVGAVVTKTITFEPRAGNPGRRLQETGGGLLNSIGLENVGAAVFFAEKLPALSEAGISAVVSLGAEDWDDYRRLLEAAGRAAVDIVELNLSCPNVERGGMAIGADPELVALYVRHARDALGEATVIAKLTPNAADIVALALSAEQAGADAVTAINTVVGMDIDVERRRPVFGRVRAGLSGPAIMPIALDAVWRISRAVDIPVIGSGGISSVGDALKFFLAGARAVQVGTALFYDPALPAAIVDALEKDGVPPPLP
ncbi:MAG: dihydroorotate dehydrogenase [Candidatus Krumholzibacteria bacterium]|nr:dihydroorotate dehydrogenase [Candidatus Krumholzibacteria bacterium]